MNHLNRRQFIATSAMASGMAFCPTELVFPIDKIKRLSKPKVRVGLNAYSFNDPLIAKTMTIWDMIEFCANLGLEAVDLTGYYFLSYPVVPTDEEIYRTKRNAFLLRVDISGTGVKNDFTVADKEKRKKDVQLVKDWVIVAEKLGAPTLRVFAGNTMPQGYTRKQVLDWMVDDMKECADFAGKHGIMIAVQNHNDFLKTADQIEELMKRVDSQWFGLMIDIGSFQTNPDPYKEIEQVIPYAISWQIKELVYVNKVETKTDLSKVAAIINRSTYRGFLPIETLGKGDPKDKITKYFSEIKEAFKDLE
jgi:sugar phosphate isomerase/epimerase